MATNRLTTYQFGPGITLDGTRVEQSLRDLVTLYNDLPADLISRRWSCSPMVWGFSPTQTWDTVPFLSELNVAGGTTLDPVTAAQIKNLYRVKSTAFPGQTGGDNSLIMEVSFSPLRPVIIGGLTLLAERKSTGAFTNVWEYGAAPPDGKNPGDPCEDVTLQVCVSDGWDIENRKKLRQESLLYKTRSDAFFANIPGSVPMASTIVPTLLPWDGFALDVMPVVLVPAGARVHFIVTIPKYATAGASTWNRDRPWIGNAFNLHAQVFEATR